MLSANLNRLTCTRFGRVHVDQHGRIDNVERRRTHGGAAVCSHRNSTSTRARRNFNFDFGWRLHLKLSSNFVIESNLLNVGEVLADEHNCCANSTRLGSHLGQGWSWFDSKNVDTFSRAAPPDRYRTRGSALGHNGIDTSVRQNRHVVGRDPVEEHFRNVCHRRSPKVNHCAGAANNGLEPGDRRIRPTFTNRAGTHRIENANADDHHHHCDGDFDVASRSVLCRQRRGQQCFAARQNIEQ